MRKKIVVVGSSNVDLIMKMERLPEKGETITDADFVQTFGGKGANQAVGAARAGGEVILVNCVGDDAYTPQMVENFGRDGIDTQYVFHEKGVASGHALIMIGDAGNNYLSVAPGANYRLTPARVDEARAAFDTAAIIVMQYEIPADTIQHVMALAEEKAIPVLWNFAPARDFDLSYLSKVSILVVNESEAEFLSGEPVQSVEDAERVAPLMVERGVSHVILTLGEKGVYCLGPDEGFHVPAFSVDTVDTTAAGDVFCGALAVAWVEQRSLREAVRFASAAAALAVTKLGAQPSVPTREEIDRFLKERA